jgi:hypothetical protein
MRAVWLWSREVEVEPVAAVDSATQLELRRALRAGHHRGVERGPHPVPVDLRREGDPGAGERPASLDRLGQAGGHQLGEVWLGVDLGRGEGRSGVGLGGDDRRALRVVPHREQGELLLVVHRSAAAATVSCSRTARSTSCR